MSSSKTIILKVCPWVWSGGLQFKYYRHWNIWERSHWFIVTWSQRTFCLRAQISPVSKLSILGQVASLMKEYTPTFNLDSIEPQKSSLEFHTLLPLTCGVSDVFWLNCSQVCPFSQEKVSKNSWAWSWRWSASQISRSCPKQGGKTYSLMRRPMNHSYRKIPRRIWECLRPSP